MNNVETRLEQIFKKISLSKVIDMNYILWNTTIDNETIKKLRQLNYTVAQEDRYFYITWNK